jgi:hypothetical protein
VLGSGSDHESQSEQNGDGDQPHHGLNCELLVHGELLLLRPDKSTKTTMRSICASGDVFVLGPESTDRGMDPADAGQNDGRARM